MRSLTNTTRKRKQKKEKRILMPYRIGGSPSKLINCGTTRIPPSRRGHLGVWRMESGQQRAMRMGAEHRAHGPAQGMWGFGQEQEGIICNQTPTWPVHCTNSVFGVTSACCTLMPRALGCLCPHLQQHGTYAVDVPNACLCSVWRRNAVKSLNYLKLWEHAAGGKVLTTYSASACRSTLRGTS